MKPLLSLFTFVVYSSCWAQQSSKISITPLPPSYFLEAGHTKCFSEDLVLIHQPVKARIQPSCIEAYGIFKDNAKNLYNFDVLNKGPVVSLERRKAKAGDDAENNICRAVSQGDFKTVERIVKKKVRDVRRDKKNYKNNLQRLDSLEAWIARKICVEDAYWNKNGGFILITTTFIHQLGVRFKTSNGIVEKCYHLRTSAQWFNAWFFWKYGIELHKKRLVLLKSEDCPGFIKMHHAIDSSNEAGKATGWHDIEVQFGLTYFSKSKGSLYLGEVYDEGKPIDVKVAVNNGADNIKMTRSSIDEEIVKSEIRSSIREEYKDSEASCYQEQQIELRRLYLNGKRNFQLIDFNRLVTKNKF